MNTAAWLVRCVAHAAVLTLLLRAGAAKLVGPAPAVAALAELRPGRGTVTVRAVRVLAAAELLVAFATVVPALRTPAAAAVAALGLCFAAAGLLGAARGGSLPCGCFGTGGSRPLGATSGWFGLLFAAVGTTQLLLSAPAAQHGTAAVLLTVTASAGWLLTDHHVDARRALRAALDRTEATA